MNAAALNIVRAAFSAAAAIDPAITEERTKNALLVLDGITGKNGQVATADPNSVLFPPIMSAEEVADVMRISVRSVRSYAQRGKIRRAYYSEDKRKAAGYVGASVRAFVESVVCDASKQTPPPEVEVEVIEN